jgi:hypothetical protein
MRREARRAKDAARARRGRSPENPILEESGPRLHGQEQRSMHGTQQTPYLFPLAGTDPEMLATDFAGDEEVRGRRVTG